MKLLKVITLFGVALAALLQSSCDTSCSDSLRHGSDSDVRVATATSPDKTKKDIKFNIEKLRHPFGAPEPFDGTKVILPLPCEIVGSESKEVLSDVSTTGVMVQAFERKEFTRIDEEWVADDSERWQGEFDDDNRLVRELYEDLDAGEEMRYRHSYDDAGQRVGTVVVPEESPVTDYSYDQEGKLVRARKIASDRTLSTRDYSYSSEQRLIQKETRYDGWDRPQVVEEFYYNANGYLKEYYLYEDFEDGLSSLKAGDADRMSSYRYSDSGRVDSVTRYQDGVKVEKAVYRYEC